MSLFLSLLFLIAPIKAENGRFTILQDGKKIGTEDFSIVPRAGGYTIQGHTVITVQNKSADLRSRMELNDNLMTTLYEVQTQGSSIRLKVGDPSSELETNVQGKSQPRQVRFPKDGVIIDDNFFHHFAILLYRVTATPATTLPAFVPQQMTIGAISIRATGPNTFELDSGNLKATATTDKDGRLIRLTVPQANVVVER